MKSASLLSACKIERLIKHLHLTRHLEGDAIEVGVYKGGSLKEIAQVVEVEWQSDKMIYGYDTFEGLPNSTMIDTGTTLKKGDFYASMYEVAENILFDEQDQRRFKNVRLVKGIFPETTLNTKISFAHLDIDFYDGTFKSLVAIDEVLSMGGIIVCDDYQYHETPGVAKAVDMFMLHNSDRYIMKAIANQAFIHKGLV